MYILFICGIFDIVYIYSLYVYEYVNFYEECILTYIISKVS